MDFKPEHKEEINASIPYGVNKVKIIGFRNGFTDSGTEYIEAGFTDEGGLIEDKARLWFTDKSAKYSFNTLKSILIHNTALDKRELATKTIDAVPSSEKLVELLNSKLVGKEMWFTKYVNPDRTYQGSDGRTYQSTDKNIYGYAPKLNEALLPKKSGSLMDAAQEEFSSTAESTDEPWA